MQLISTIVLGAASLAIASPTTQKLQARDPTQIAECDNSGFPQFTIARLAGIIGQFQGPCDSYSSTICETTVFAVAPGTVGKLLNCDGGTGVYLTVNPSTDGSIVNHVYSASQFGDNLMDGYRFCYGGTPNVDAGDTAYIASYTFWGVDYNLVVRGDVDCKHSHWP